MRVSNWYQVDLDSGIAVDGTACCYFWTKQPRQHRRVVNCLVLA